VNLPETKPDAEERRDERRAAKAAEKRRLRGRLVSQSRYQNSRAYRLQVRSLLRRILRGSKVAEQELRKLFDVEGDKAKRAALVERAASICGPVS
jgi:hypothetical protein